MRNGSLTPLLLLVLFIGFMWLVLIRPQRNRARQMQAMQSRLTIGSEVMTTAGLFGRVVSIDEDTVTLEVAPGVTNRFIRQAIGRVVSGEPEPSPATGTYPGENPGENPEEHPAESPPDEPSPGGDGRRGPQP